MSRVSWNQFKDRQSQVHLVAIVQVDQPTHGPQLKDLQQVLHRLLRSQKPRGDYATTTVREAGRPELYLAFAKQDDADKLAAAVQAVTTDSYPGWMTQRAVRLKNATVAALAKSFPLPNRRPKPPPEGELTSHDGAPHGWSRAPRPRDD